MPHQRPPPDAQRARPPIRLAHAPVVGLQPLQLPSMQLDGNHIPQPRAGRRLGSVHTGGQHPGIYRMTAERLVVLLAGFREPVLCAQLLGLPACPQLERQAHRLQHAVQMRLAHLHRAEARVPLPARARARRSVDIFDHHLGHGQDGQQLTDDAGLGLPAAAGGGGQAPLPREPVLMATRPSPEPRAPGTAQHASRFDDSFHVGRRLHHEIADGRLGPHHTEPLALGARVDAHHERLVVGSLSVAQL